MTPEWQLRHFGLTRQDLHGPWDEDARAVLDRLREEKRGRAERHNAAVAAFLNPEPAETQTDATTVLTETPTMVQLGERTFVRLTRSTPTREWR